MKQSLELNYGHLSDLENKDLMIIGGNPVVAGIGLYFGALAAFYYLGYGAHYAYDALVK